MEGSDGPALGPFNFGQWQLCVRASVEKGEGEGEG